MRCIKLGLLVLALGLVACSDDDDPKKDIGTEIADVGGDTLEQDLGLPPDKGDVDPCASEWIDAINAHDKTASGEVATTDQTGFKATIINASAGGMTGAHNFPWVYVSFKDGSKAEITDMASKTSKDWDLAFRRSTIRSNGGDSGAGGVEVATLKNKKLADVTAAPTSGFESDDFLNENCDILRDPINGPQSVFNGPTPEELWYTYDVATSKVAPFPNVYVIKRPDGTHVKLEIISYYEGGGGGGTDAGMGDGNSLGESGHYTIHWSTL